MSGLLLADMLKYLLNQRLEFVNRLSLGSQLFLLVMLSLGLNSQLLCYFFWCIGSKGMDCVFT